jgi:peptidyl-prolyl cis-trans isomerase C
MRKISKACICLALFCSALPAAGQQGEVVARVNGVPITEQELQAQLRQTINQAYYHRRLPPDKEKEIRAQSLDVLIKNELYFQEAGRQNLKAERGEIQDRFDRIAAKFPSPAAFKKALEGQNMSEKDLRDRIRRQLIIESVYRTHVLDAAGVTEQEVRSYYEENREKFTKPESVELQHILIKAEDPASQDSWDQAEAEAREIHERLRSGEDFAALASKYSDDKFSIKGGHLGSVHRGRLLPELEEAAFSMPKGQTSGPIRTRMGYHILKLLDKNAAEQLGFDEVAETLRKDLENKRRQQNEESWLQKLKASAHIEILIEHD